MIKVSTSGIAAFNQALSLELARLDREISFIFYRWTIRIFRELVEDSPQWSGDLASNWNYSVGSPDYSYSRSPNKTGDDARVDYWRQDQGVFQRGHPNAVLTAMSRMEMVRPPAWRDTVYFANATPIAPSIPNIKIRPVNMVNGQVIMIEQVVMRESQKTGVEL
jgi:hypothetical protein